MKVKCYKNPTTKENSFQVPRGKFIAFNKTSNLNSRGAGLLSIDKKRGKAFIVFQGDEDIQNLANRHFRGKEVLVLRCRAALEGIIIFDYQKSLFKKEKKSEK